MLFLTEDNPFVGTDRTITMDEIEVRLVWGFVKSDDGPNPLVSNGSAIMIVPTCKVYPTAWAISNIHGHR